jgi:hypothetical protein
MEVIAEHFEDGTFRYDQIERQGMVAMYIQTHKRSGIKRYEVVILHIQHAHVWQGGTYTPEKEAYPASSAWGKQGWTYQTRSAALTNYTMLALRPASGMPEA